MIHIVTKYSAKVYSPESILLTAHDLRKYASVFLFDSNDELVVESTIDEGVISEPEFISLFKKTLIDNQLRVCISEKTSAIRQMIIAQAFAPCDNLNEIVEVFENNEQ